MKKVLISSLSILLAGILLGGCGNSQGKKQSAENRNSSLKAENSSLKENIKKNSNNVSSSDRQNSNDQSEAPKSETSTSSNSAQSSSSGPIQSAQDAENLITHSMHVNPGIYHAVPTTGGFIVSRDDIPGSAFVQNNGNVTWDDGSTTSYGEASAPTNNQ